MRTSKYYALRRVAIHYNHARNAITAEAKREAEREKREDARAAELMARAEAARKVT